MTFVTPRGGEVAGADAARLHPYRPATPDLRAVLRAVADLRRGTPVLLATGRDHCVVVPAETLGAAGLAEFAAAATGPFLLLLGQGRAERWAVSGRTPDESAGDAAVAFKVFGPMLEPEALRGVADPTAAQWFSGPAQAEPLPHGADAALALAKLARLLPAMLVAQARPGDGAPGALLTVAAADVLAYPAASSARLLRASEAQVPLEGAPDARLVTFRGPDGGIEHLAILVGAPEARGAADPAPLARIHSECFTGDLLGSLRCDCGTQLRGAIRRMAEEGAGALLYLAQEGRGIGLVNKLRAYALQDAGLDTLDANRALGWGADERDYAPAATMLRALGIMRVRLLTNNPQKLAALAAGGIVVERVSHLVAGNGINDAYLATKADRFGHLGD